MILTYIDDDGTSYDLPSLTKSINTIIKDIDANIAKGNDDGAFIKMLELSKKCFGEEQTKKMFGSTRYDESLKLTELNVACVEIAKAYRKPVEDARFQDGTVDKVTELLKSLESVKDIGFFDKK